MKSQIGKILLPIAVAVIVFGALQATLQSFKVEGASMEPSFHQGQYVLVNKVLYSFHAPQRGEVVVFSKEPGVSCIKRVIGLPEEVIEIKEDKLYINGKLLEEPSYIPLDYRYHGSVKVPQDYYFVLGDNRNHSGDSRIWGPIPRQSIVGKVWLCYWPPDEWGLSPSYSLARE